MVETIIEPYNHNVYHAGTPASLHTATQVFTSRNAQHSINTVIRDCFLKHNVEDAFSACLNHRHFDLRPDERNIEEGGVAIASRDFNDIQPCTWLFYQGKLYPYEFKRVRVGQSLSVPPAEFAAELCKVLQESQLADLIGIQLYTDGIIGLETTDHVTRTSTTVDYQEGSEDFKHYAKAMASFAFFR
jgi:hypothetical protein